MTDPRHELATTMAEVARELLEERSQTTVEAIVAKAVEIVPDAEAASLTLRSRRQGLTTLAATSAIARSADSLQYECDEGPCLEAAEAADWYRSGDTAADPRWRRWGPKAAAEGVQSFLSVPLLARGQRIGALNLFSSDKGRFSDAEELDVALVFAVHAAQALASARLVSGLEVALSSRHAIGVAQGILIERFGLDLDQAFSVLRRISSQTNTKISTIARHIVDTGKVPTLDAPVETSAGDGEGELLDGPDLNIVE